MQNKHSKHKKRFFGFILALGQQLQKMFVDGCLTKYGMKNNTSNQEGVLEEMEDFTRTEQTCKCI